jgi:hypothetical protein
MTECPYYCAGTAEPQCTCGQAQYVNPNHTIWCPCYKEGGPVCTCGKVDRLLKHLRIIRKKCDYLMACGPLLKSIAREADAAIAEVDKK